MRIGRWQIKRRVIAGAVGAVLVTGAWVVWTQRTRLSPGVPPGGPEPFVRVVGGGGQSVARVLKERTEFFDPTPLFYPTNRNYEQRELPASLKKQPGELFGNFAEKLVYSDSNMPVQGAPPVQAPERLIDALAQGVQAPFAGFGQIDVARPPLPERSAMIEVTALSNGKLVVSQPISDGVKALRGDLVPPEFLVAVAPAGLVGDLVAMKGGAGEDELRALRDYLVNTFRLGQRLEPGTYRVTVGP